MFASLSLGMSILSPVLIAFLTISFLLSYRERYRVTASDANIPLARLSLPAAHALRLGAYWRTASPHSSFLSVLLVSIGDTRMLFEVSASSGPITVAGPPQDAVLFISKGELCMRGDEDA